MSTVSIARRDPARRHDRRQFLRHAGTAALGALAGTAFPAFSMPRSSDLKVKELTTFVMPDAIFVKLTATNGAVGWGECCPDNIPLMETFVHSSLAEEVVGEDPFDSQDIYNEMFFGNHDLGPGGALPNAIAGIDMALWDMKGRILDVPVHAMLGGTVNSKVPVYGSYATSRWRKMTPQQAVEKGTKFVRRGFKTVKCRMQIRENHMNPIEDRTIEYVDALSKGLPKGTEFFVDINNGYSAARAIQIGRVLQDKYGLRYYEEPCSDQNHSETAAVVEALDMAIIAGEKEYTLWQLAELIRYANVDFINPDVVKCGGITELFKISHFAQAYTRPLILHNTRPTLATAASLQVLAPTLNMGPFMEMSDTEDYPELMACLKNVYRYHDGFIDIPDGPGLGVDVDEAKVRARSTSVKTVVDK